MSDEVCCYIVPRSTAFPLCPREVIIIWLIITVANIHGGKSTGGGHGNPLQYSCLENPHRAWTLEGYGLKGCRVRHEWNDLAQHAQHWLGLPRWRSGKESACQCRRCKKQVWSLGGEDPQERKWQPTPVFLPGKFQGQRSPVGYSPSSHKKLYTAEHNIYWEPENDQAGICCYISNNLMIKT